MERADAGGRWRSLGCGMLVLSPFLLMFSVVWGGYWVAKARMERFGTGLAKVRSLDEIEALARAQNVTLMSHERDGEVRHWVRAGCLGAWRICNVVAVDGRWQLQDCDSGPR